MAAVRAARDVGGCPVRVDRQPTIGRGAHGDSWRVEDSPQWMVHWSARDKKRDCRGIRDGDVKISEHLRNGGAGCQDRSIYPEELPTSGHHACYRATIGSNGALPRVGDELPAAAQEVLDQKLSEARQVDPSLAGVPDRSRVRNGCCIDSWNVGADLVASQQVTLVTVAHLMLMSSTQLLSLVVRVPYQPPGEAQPGQTGLLRRQGSVAIYAGHP